jgi:predicted ATP-grasp superfamily ATP-dependent carboligase
MSAVYVAARGQAVLLGVTLQLLGDGYGREPFRYVGSQGPIDVRPSVREELNRLGAFLAERFKLRGIIGVDVVLADERLWTIEVNPRLPASAELLERAGDLSVVALHVAACTDGSLPASCPAFAGYEGEKRILFADRALRINAEKSASLLALAGDPLRPAIADIPRPGIVIQAGQPVLTLFSDSGQSIAAAVHRLVALQK